MSTRKIIAKHYFSRLLMALIFSVFCLKAGAQAKLVINGGVITLNNGASLVIDNPDNNAISRNNSGYIVSEAPNNNITWSLGAGNGNVYLLPFGNAAGYFPVRFTAAGGIPGTGRFVFSTYPVNTWKNSD